MFDASQAKEAAGRVGAVIHTLKGFPLGFWKYFLLRSQVQRILALVKLITEVLLDYIHFTSSLSPL